MGRVTEEDRGGPGRPRLKAGEETRRIFVKLPLSLLRDVDSAARDAGVTRSDWVRLALALSVHRPQRKKRGPGETGER